MESTKGSTFADLHLRPEILTVLSALGHDVPTPIQREAIPTLIAGRDLLGQAATGTGKTAAFALPILQGLADDHRSRAPRALVLVPTRELAVQVSAAMHGYGRGLGVRVVPIYGGQPIFRQLQALERGVDVVVATPGRALDHITRGTLVLSDLAIVVLDEADEMLDMGFAEDLEEILATTPEQRQTVMFSATLPRRIDAIAKRHLRDPVRVEISRPQTSGDAPPLVRQCAYIVARAHKAAALGRLIDVEIPGAALVFCRTREDVDRLTETLTGRGYRAEALHGGMDQTARDRVMGRIRSESADLLIATDVAARGLDIDHLTHVVNYDVPTSPDAYVHRIGRVGRAGRGGVAITLAEPREHSSLKNIERATKQHITIKALPTVADLRAHRLGSTANALREAILSNELYTFSGIVSTLSNDFDIAEIALAAIKLAHEAGGAVVDENEIPELRMNFGQPAAPRHVRPARGPSQTGSNKRRPRTANTSRIWINAGRAAGVRPGDLVGAIAGESHLNGQQIGGIEIAERFSLVEIPMESVETVIRSLETTTIRGRKIVVRPERPAEAE